MQVYINYHGTLPIEKISVGDWIDLRSAEDVELSAFESRRISLGISMELPEEYEAHVCARSSTFDKWGIMLVNGMGIIDNSYRGDEDVWKAHVIAMRDTKIYKGDRIVQFRIMRKQPDYSFVEVEKLSGSNRGGWGSTGHN